MNSADVATPPAEAMLEAFARLEGMFEQAGPAQERWLSIGGRPVRLLGTPPLLGRLFPALAHHQIDPVAPPELEIRLWDLASAGQTLPESPLIPKPGDPPLRPIYRSQRFVFQLFERTLSFYDRDTRQALYCASDAALITMPEWAAPLRLILNWWGVGSGLHLLHSGAVGDERGAVLLSGPGGSGKSTTSLACAADGLLFAGDDYVLASTEPPLVHPLYRSAKLDRAQAARHPELLTGPLADDGPDEKLCALIGDAIAQTLPLRAIAVPTVSGGARPDAVPIHRARVLRALAPSTLFVHPEGGSEALRAMAALASRVPCFELRLTPDLAAVTDVVRGILAGESE